MVLMGWHLDDQVAVGMAQAQSYRDMEFQSLVAVVGDQEGKEVGVAPEDPKSECCWVVVQVLVG